MLGAKDIDEIQKSLLVEAYEFVEKFLENKSWIAGDSFTIADMSFITSISSWAKLVPVSNSDFPRIKAWINRVEKLPCYEANVSGQTEFEEVVRPHLNN